MHALIISAISSINKYTTKDRLMKCRKLDLNTWVLSIKD